MNLYLRLAGVFGALLAAASAAQPNILFIMTDQHSADALSCRMGDRYLKTPNLDRLFRQVAISPASRVPRNSPDSAVTMHLKVERVVPNALF